MSLTLTGTRCAAQCAGRYMSVTEPSAIYYLIDKLDDKLDIRFYADSLRPFHPKAYIFDYEEDAEIFVGSSNLSHSALTSGLEWNYRLLRSQNATDYEIFSKTFDDLFDNCTEKITHEVLKKYALSWIKPSFNKNEQASEQQHLADTGKIVPRGAQVEALYELKKAREEGASSITPPQTAIRSSSTTSSPGFCWASRPRRTAQTTGISTQSARITSYMRST